MPVTPRWSGTGQRLSRRSPFTNYLATLQSSGLHILVDDTRDDVFSYYGKAQVWPVGRDSRWAGGTETRFEGGGSPGAHGGFELAVYGKNVQIIGRAPSTPDATFTYTIDDSGAVQNAFSSPPPTSSPTSTEAFPYKRWASISLPPDSRSHRLLVSDLPAGTSVDYAIVNVHESAQVSKELAIMDDAEGSLEWKGAWDEVKAEDISEEVAAYGGGAHSSREVGSEVKFSFIGSSVSLYTISPPSFLSVSFTLDGGAPQTRTYDPISPNQSQNQSIMPNYLLYTLAGLSSSLHTLTVKLTENAFNSSLVLDYITYTPSFTSLAALASSGGDPAKYSASSSGSDDQAGARGRTMSPATMAGTIIGVLVVVAVLISCFCCQGKRHFVRRAWRNWRRGKTVGKESEKEAEDEKSSTDFMRKPSPDWAFRNPHASQYASRTSLEMDLDLDISPRARERRHQERDMARPRNKNRTSESRGESSRGHGMNLEHERSRHRTRGKAHSGASGVGRQGPDRNERADTGTPSVGNRSTAGSVSLDHGSNLGERVSELLTEATLSEVALGKRPDRGFVGNPIRHEADREAPPTLPVPAHSTIPQPSALESARATKARMIVGRIEEGFATMKMRRRRERKDKAQMKWAKPVLEAIAAEWWLDNEPNLRAKVLSLRRELDKEERRLARMGPEHYASQRHRQRRTGTARESRDRETRMHHEPVDAHLIVEEGGGIQGENRARRSNRVGKRKMRVGFSTRTMHPTSRNPTLRKKRWKRALRAVAENTDPEWVDEDPISEASLITPFPHSTNSVTPFTSMRPSSPASASRLKDSKGQEERENVLTPFTATQPLSSPSPSKRSGGKGDESTENILTPFTTMQPSSGPPSKLKDGDGKGKVESNVTPFTTMEPSTSRPKLKDVKYRTTAGGLRPFMLLQPHPRAVSSKKRDERASHPPSAPFPQRPSRHSLPEILTQFPNPPIPEGDLIIQSPLALQSQLSALIEEINAQHNQGQIPSPERLEEMVRLGRAIEESVKQIEERGAGDGVLPPPYHTVTDDDDDDERIGIAL